MKIRQTKKITYDLTLNAEEAYFLKCLVQNAQNANSYGDGEDDNNRRIRQSFWEALPSMEHLQKDLEKD